MPPTLLAAASMALRRLADWVSMLIRLGLRPVLVAIFVVGCASTPRVGGDPALHTTEQAMPAPVEADLAYQIRPYRIGPRDKLVVDVFGLAELSNREITVDPNGDLSFPIAGKIHVSGSTPAEVQVALAEGLRAGGVRRPIVTVNVKEEVSQTLTVDGQVKEPGVYPVIGRMTLIRAVAAAKGPDEYAKLTDVVIFRTVSGQKMAGLYDLRAIRRGAYPDPEVYASDVIVVGDSPARRLFRDSLIALPNVLTPLIVLLSR